MGKVSIIAKSRKECTCGKCRSIIPVGSKYYRGSLNFSKDIIRCDICKLESWEVTTSPYLLAVGDVLYNWSSNFELGESTAEEVSSQLQEILDEQQNNLDNMPENLQESPTAELINERIEALESAIGELESIDYDSIKTDVISNEYPDAIVDTSEEMDAFMESLSEEDKESLEEAINDSLQEAIDEALGCIEI